MCEAEIENERRAHCDLHFFFDPLTSDWESSQLINKVLNRKLNFKNVTLVAANRTHFTFIMRRSFTLDQTCIFPTYSYEIEAIFLPSQAITVPVKKIWQAWQVSPSQLGNEGQESCNFWSQLLKFCLFSFILLSRGRIEWKLPTVLLSYAMACFYVPSHLHITYSLYFVPHSNLFKIKMEFWRCFLQDSKFLHRWSMPMGNIYSEFLCSV